MRSCVGCVWDVSNWLLIEGILSLMHPLTALTLDGLSALAQDGDGQLQLQKCCTGMNLLACLCRCFPGRLVMIGASALGLAVSQNLEHYTGGLQSG